MGRKGECIIKLLMIETVIVKVINIFCILGQQRDL